jgi:hypothetical protein
LVASLLSFFFFVDLPLKLYASRACASGAGPHTTKTKTKDSDNRGPLACAPALAFGSVGSSVVCRVGRREDPKQIHTDALAYTHTCIHIYNIDRRSSGSACFPHPPILIIQRQAGLTVACLSLSRLNLAKMRSRALSGLVLFPLPTPFFFPVLSPFHLYADLIWSSSLQLCCSRRPPLLSPLQPPFPSQPMGFFCGALPTSARAGAAASRPGPRRRGRAPPPPCLLPRPPWRC